MEKFETNHEMETLIKARTEQPDLFSLLSPVQKLQVGIYQNAKAAAAETHELSADEKLTLAGLKQQIAQDNLSPLERTSTALKILELETK